MNKFLTWLAAKKVSAVPDKYVHFVHMAIALAAVLVASIWLPIIVPVIAMAAVAFGIEFWFDAKYEKQSFLDNLHDFEDYTIGIFLAVLLHKL